MNTIIKNRTTRLKSLGINEKIIKYKEEAYILKNLLAIKDNRISHSACLEAIALKNGYDNWIQLHDAVLNEARNIINE